MQYHPHSAPATITQVVAPAAEYYEKPAISFGALRAAMLGVLVVVSVIGSLLLYWLHTPATATQAAAGQPVLTVQAAAR